MTLAGQPQDGSELTSAAGAKVKADSEKAGIGTEARGGEASVEDLQNTFGDLDDINHQFKDDTAADEQRKVEAKEEFNQRQEVEEEPEEEVVEEEEETVDEEETTEEEEEETTTSDEEGEVIEVDEEYGNFLMGLEKDQLAARVVKHKKGEATYQSKLDKIKAVVGDNFINGAVEGNIPKEVKILIGNLSDPAFQEYVGDFYSSHELRDGLYVKTREDSPPPDKLKEYAGLISEKATLSIDDFMGDSEEEFDYNTAIRRPGSASGLAWSKFKQKESEINTKLSEIEQQSVGSLRQEITPEQQAAAGKEAMNTLISKYSDLGKKEEYEGFEEFVRSGSLSPLEAYYLAYKSNGRAKKKTKQFILREIKAIENNKESSTKNIKGTAKKNLTKAKKTDKSKYEDPTIQADADYFGDYE